MSYHYQRIEGGAVTVFHRREMFDGAETVTRNTMEFNPGPPTKSRKAKSKIMIPGLHRTHPRRFA